MEEKDVRWIQRFSNYKKALHMLGKGIDILLSDGDFSSELKDLMQEGLIQRFEYTLELAWNVMKDYAEYQGVTDVLGSRSAIRQAMQMGLITDRQWIRSVDDRNLSSHDYDKTTADEIRDKIIEVYYPLFVDFKRSMEERLDEN